MFGSIFGGGGFRAWVRQLALSAGATVVDCDDDTATLRFPGGKYAPYPVGVSQMDDGRVLVTCFSVAAWRGGAPRIAHVIMEKMDAEMESVSCAVKSFEGSGRTRCTGATMVAGRDRLTPRLLGRVAGELMGSMAVADRLLREHGGV
ncbi:MAG: hypothetical protein K2X91_18925 [Thermoleophilia bacterium]|nr:hypothetical protein [Thermoleophilia bacterium]